MQTNIKHSRIENTLSRHALALIIFAASDPIFARTLKTYFSYLPFQTQEDSDEYTVSPLLVPSDRETASARAAWLQRELLSATPHTATARVVLSRFIHEQHPQNVVLGIVGVAIIGPTLGLIKKKKKRKSQMRVILPQSGHQTTTAQISAYVQQATLGLLSNELAQVHGDAYRLDPELADWLFTEHATELRVATPEELETSMTELQSEHLPHFVLKNGDDILAIAIAPSVSDLYQPGAPI